MTSESSPTADSGLSELSTSNNSSMNLSPIIDKNKAINQTDVEEEDDKHEDLTDFDETLAERLIGLTEMFPNCVRNGFVNVLNSSVLSAKYFYGLSRSALWVLFTSSAFLLAPLALEMERSQMEEYSRQQQRQILLGPSAALSGGTHGLSPIPPPLQPPTHR